MATKQELISQVFDQALAKLLAMPAKDYTALLAKLAAAAAEGKEAVVMSPKDRESIGSAVVDQANQLLAAAGKTPGLTLSPETRACKGGLLPEIWRCGD